MYQNIMVPLDGSQLAECVLPNVKSFIQGCRVHTVTLVRVVESAQPRFAGAPSAGVHTDYEKVLEYVRRNEEERKLSAAAYLEEIGKRLKSDGVQFRMDVLAGEVADTLVDYAEARPIDLILIATHGRSGVSRWVRGSIADRILRASRVPVLMVRAPGTN
jgi:nucleotide-binding universal stress UspA family protein